MAQTGVPGISVSQVARRYDVNANMVFKWLRDPQFKPSEEEAASFLPVAVLPEAAVVVGDADVSDSKKAAPKNHPIDTLTSHIKQLPLKGRS